MILRSWATMLRWMWRGEQAPGDDQEMRVAVNRVRAARGREPMTRAEFDANGEAVRAKIAENGGTPRGRLRTIRWAMTRDR